MNRRTKSQSGASLMELMVGTALIGIVISASTAVSKIAASQVTALNTKDSIEQLTDMMRSRLQFADSCTESFGNNRLNINPLISNSPASADQVTMRLPDVANPSSLLTVGADTKLNALGLEVTSLEIRNPVPLNAYVRSDGITIREYIGHLQVSLAKLNAQSAVGVAGGSTFVPKYIGSIILSANQDTGDIESCHGTVAESFENVCKIWGCTFTKGASPECACDYDMNVNCIEPGHIAVGVTPEGTLNCVPFGGQCPPNQYVKAAGPNSVTCATLGVPPQWVIGAWDVGCPNPPWPGPPDYPEINRTRTVVCTEFDGTPAPGGDADCPQPIPDRTHTCPTGPPLPDPDPDPDPDPPPPGCGWMEINVSAAPSSGLCIRQEGYQASGGGSNSCSGVDHNGRTTQDRHTNCGDVTEFIDYECQCATGPSLAGVCQWERTDYEFREGNNVPYFESEPFPANGTAPTAVCNSAKAAGPTANATQRYSSGSNSLEYRWRCMCY